MPKRNGSGIELLADPVRRQIIAMIALQSRRPTRIAEELGLSLPAVSRQLRLLREAGLIRGIPSMFDGRVTEYAIVPEASRRILAWLALTEIGRADEDSWPALPKPPPGFVDLRGLNWREHSATLLLLAAKEREYLQRRERLRLERAKRRHEAVSEERPGQE
jgi:DNA-binding transcriptional ArsR family regulator